MTHLTHELLDPAIIYWRQRQFIEGKVTVKVSTDFLVGLNNNFPGAMGKFGEFDEIIPSIIRMLIRNRRFEYCFFFFIDQVDEVRHR